MANETLNLAQSIKIAETFAGWFKSVAEIPETKPTADEYNALPDDIKSEYTLTQYQNYIINQRKQQLIDIRDQLDADKAIVAAGNNIGFYANIPVQIGYTDTQKQEFGALADQVRAAGVAKWQTLNNL